jgi:hypothetical protein
MAENQKTNLATVRFSSGVGNTLQIKFPEVRSNNQYIYYTKEGDFLGGNLNSDKVYISTKEEYNKAKNKRKWLYLNDDTKLIKNIDGKPIHHHLFIAFASAVWAESSGIEEESCAIANSFINFLKNEKTVNLKSLEDIVMYENAFSYGVKQSLLNNFLSKREYEKNSKGEIKAVINALHPEFKIPFSSDYSQGADAWDGIDLVQSTRKNSHRGYIWSSDSKILLEKYKKERNGGVDVSKFTYKDKDYQIKALVIIGKTIFCKSFTNRTEKKQGSKFSIKL